MGIRRVCDPAYAVADPGGGGWGVGGRGWGGGGGGGGPFGNIVRFSLYQAVGPTTQ